MEVVAINPFDSADRIQGYQQQGKFTFPLLQATPKSGERLAEVVRAYGVQAYPTNYLVGKDGKVAARFLGFNEKGLREAIARLVANR